MMRECPSEMSRLLYGTVQPVRTFIGNEADPKILSKDSNKEVSIVKTSYYERIGRHVKGT